MKLLTIQEVAKVLNVKDKAIYSYIHNGNMPHICLGKKTIRIKEDELLSWISSKSNNTTLENTEVREINGSFVRHNNNLQDSSAPQVIEKFNKVKLITTKPISYSKEYTKSAKTLSAEIFGK